MQAPVFSEMLIAPGTMLYKGLPVPCDRLLKDLRSFYLTDDVRYADQYGKTVCAYRVKKNLRLFEMTRENIKKVLAGPDLKPMTKLRIRMAFGTGVTLGNQIDFLKKEKRAKDIPRGRTTKELGLPGQRASWANLNKLMSNFFSEEFFSEDARIIERGNKGVTKFFEIPFSLRFRKKKEYENLYYQKLETATKIFYIYTVKKNRFMI